MITRDQLAAAFRLDGSSALVTGAGSVVGAAISEAFAAAGAAVLVTDVDPAAAAAVADGINAAGGRAESFGLDVRDGAAATEAEPPGFLQEDPGVRPAIDARSGLVGRRLDGEGVKAHEQ